MLKRLLVSICNRMVGKSVEEPAEQDSLEVLQLRIMELEAENERLLNLTYKQLKMYNRVKQDLDDEIKCRPVEKVPTFTMTHQAYKDMRKQFLPPIVNKNDEDASFRLGCACVLMYLGDNHVAR